MIIYISAEATLPDIKHLCGRLEFMGFGTHLSESDGMRVIIITTGVTRDTDVASFSTLPFVAKVAEQDYKLKLTGANLKSGTTQIKIKNKFIGGGEFIVMAGPCAIESAQQIMDIATAVKKSGASVLRGGAFKPRTSPYDFQGLGEDGLKYMRAAADANDMLCVSEVMATEDIELLVEYVDILQIGARNMQNYSLLKALGGAGKPIMLKRGLCATYNEFLSAAEYIISYGNPDVILCERGIRTFETHTRNTLDIAAVPVLRELTHLPIVVDPSHGVGIRSAIAPMTYAAAAVKADGAIIEVHTHPDKSVSDAAQAISPAMFAELMLTLRKITDAVGMTLEDA